MRKLITFCKKNFGCIKFFEDGTYKLYDAEKDIDEEIIDKKEKIEFLKKIKRFELTNHS